MAQHIGIKIIGNDLNVIDNDINFADIYNTISIEPKLKYLSKIQPYNDAIFEGIEIKYLMCDLDNQLNDKNIELITSLNKLLSQAEQVIFIGD